MIDELLIELIAGGGAETLVIESGLLLPAAACMASIGGEKGGGGQSMSFPPPAMHRGEAPAGAGKGASAYPRVWEDMLKNVSCARDSIQK